MPVHLNDSNHSLFEVFTGEHKMLNLPSIQMYTVEEQGGQQKTHSKSGVAHADFGEESGRGSLRHSLHICSTRKAALTGDSPVSLHIFGLADILSLDSVY